MLSGDRNQSIKVKRGLTRISKETGQIFREGEVSSIKKGTVAKGKRWK